MAQHDYDIANAAGAPFRADLNAALAAVVTANSGATAPATTFAFMYWADTTAGLLKQRNAANSAWIDVLTLATGLPVNVSPRATRIDVASVAGTVNMTTAAPDSDDIRITGALAITAFTVAVGRVLRVTAAAAFTLANNASIVTQTGALLTMAAGDTFMLRATAANVVEVLGLVRAAGAAAAGRLLRITRYTTAGSGTWNRPADTVSVLITTIAGGAGGQGGSVSANAISGGGGGAGGTAILFIASAAASYAYTVGAGGAGGATSNGAGGAGGATTIAGISGGNGSGVTGGTPTGGGVNIRGGNGSGGAYGDAVTTLMPGGTGGGSSLGGNGGGGGSDTSGSAGVVGGGGGGGGVRGNTVGGAGGAGYIEIKEYS